MANVSNDVLEAVDTSTDEEGADDNDELSTTSDLPSCLESLASSSDQLQQLAKQLGRICIPKLLCYSYVSTAESNETQISISSPADGKKSQLSGAKNSINLEDFNKDKSKLESLNTLVEILPFLNELCNLIEDSFMTIESTLKRSTYYLNKSYESKESNQMVAQDEFQLTKETKIHPIFISLMDLAYVLVSLDKTIQSHGSTICADLISLKAACELILKLEQVDSYEKLDDDDDDDVNLSKLPKDRLSGLIEYITNIQMTLFNNQNKSIFQQCLEHLQHLNLHLSANKSSKGYRSLCEQLEEFIEFYGEHLIELNGNLMTTTNQMSTTMNQLKLNSSILINSNLIPTQYMTSAARKLFGLSSLFILYSFLVKKPNKQLVKTMMQTLYRFKSTTNLIHLLGSNCYIELGGFLTKHLPKPMLDAKIMRELNDQSEKWLKSNTDDEFEKFTLKVIPWLFQFKAETVSQNRLIKSTNNTAELHTNHIKQLNLFNRGLHLANEINHSIKSFIASYLQQNRPMSKNQLVPLIRMITLLKSIDDSLTQKQMFVYQNSIDAEQLLRNTWKQLIIRIQKRLISLRYTERQLDTGTLLTLTSICSRVDSYLCTDWGRRIMSITLSMLTTTLNVEELNQLNQLMSFIYPIPLYDRVREATNCGYLYWSWPTLSAYYNYAFEEDPCAFDEIHYLHMALNDIASLFSLQITSSSSSKEDAANVLLKKRDGFLKKLAHELMDQFRIDFLDKLCQELEVELRLQTHRELHLDGHNPFRRHLYNFKRIFGAQRGSKSTMFCIMNEQVSMRHYVEQHLNRVCYNLTAIAPHDWFTYDSMINLAKIRYDLHLANTQLPTQSLDCGLDLLDITRHLALFVARYGYDLTNQLFIEKCSNRLSTSSAASVFSTGAGGGGGGGGGGALSMISANIIRTSHLNLSLNVIQVKHIAKSIQTHGYGVLNSSVNCTYQVMKRLVNLFAKQMADDKLRATLTKEHLAISSGKQTGISFERASKMAKKFRLSVTNQSHADSAHHHHHQQQIGSDLDSLRQSITQLGNLLGFVRMLKSGALNCASKSADYLPDLDNISSINMSKLVSTEFGTHRNNLDSKSLHEASKNFDQCLTDLDDHFSPKTNYFGIVIDLFRQTFTGATNIGANKRNEEETIDETKRCGSSTSIGEQQRTTTINLEFSTPKTISSPIGDENQNQNQKLNEELEGSRKPQVKSSSRKSSNKREHLSLFSTLVPALTINYIDHIINCKERASSRSSATRFGALISDDGFSMGVAFLLTVLEQSQSFAKLQWFKEIDTKLVEDKREVEQRMQDSRYDESLRQTSSMTLRRLNRLQVEYRSLNYTLSSALLFFRSSTFVR